MSEEQHAIAEQAYERENELIAQAYDAWDAAHPNETPIREQLVALDRTVMKHRRDGNRLNGEASGSRIERERQKHREFKQQQRRAARSVERA
jgi:hypothetical protein